MSKSTKKQTDRLRDSCRREKHRSERHKLRQLIRENRWDDIENITEDPPDDEEVVEKD